ncbi:cyclin-like protein [Trametes versicolor FP-101664 SS1]|uniref:cyclin-like protein n=1 Tax=Trametes versicolor (strain FP-101664) TaxID=717944 RepID=UPI00046230FD|nr:cyclin-like protein [Trametes versicolor FP-101664 SS1]EIW60484.1 cyclin-like protein [Trametes versicolor FP-101664 SS1]
MGATNLAATTSSQWMFPLSALHNTPSRATSNIPLEKELYDRSRGVEFLYRLGVSLGLPSSAMYTAATWFHRFYMRYSMEDYHRQDVAASCIFLATKTEECGRKLRDVAKVVCSKVSHIDISKIKDDSKEVEECQTSILLTEEVLLEGLCFDFVVDSPQADLVDLFDACPNSTHIEECAWSIANDSYRTPLCLLYPTRIIAAACYVLAERALEGPQSSSLDDRIASPAPSASLPTPPSHKSPWAGTSRRAIEHFGFNETELASVADALGVLLEYYGAQDLQGACEFLSAVASIPPPHSCAHREALYKPFAHVAAAATAPVNAVTPEHAISQGATPSQGGSTPGKPAAGAWKPVSEPAP